MPYKGRKLIGPRWKGLTEALREVRQEITIGWYREVEIQFPKQPADTDVKGSAVLWRSDGGPFDKWLSSHIPPDMLPLDSNNTVITEEVFLRTFDRVFRIHLVPRHSSYSSVSTAALRAVVDVFGQSSPLGKRSAHTAKLDVVAGQSDGQAKLMDSMVSVGGEHLREAMKRAQQSIAAAGPVRQKKWDDLCTIVYTKLTMINNRYLPHDYPPESARRMVINEFITAVADFLGMEFTLEQSNIGTREERIDTVGWGPLDYCMLMPADRSTSLVLVPATEIVKVNPNDKPEDTPNVFVSHTGSEQALYDVLSHTLDPLQISNVLRDVEAKRVFSDQTLTRLGAQLYDCLQLQKAEDRSKDIVIYGCLCTGHRWMYVKMSWLVASPEHRPVFSYVGQVGVRVLRAWTRDAALRSGFLPDKVNEMEVKNVMLALYSSLA